MKLSHDASRSVPSVRNEAYRANVAKEILQTERAYVESLKLVQQHFLEPMAEYPDLLDVKAIHVGITIILGYSNILLNKLMPRVQNWSPRQCLADVFLSLTDYMKVYTQYVKDYTPLVQQLVVSKSNPEFVGLLKVRRCRHQRKLKRV